MIAFGLALCGATTTAAAIVALTADELAQTKASTLLVFAADDPMGGPVAGERVATALADAELHVGDGGHAPWLHCSDQITSVVSSFLQRM